MFTRIILILDCTGECNGESIAPNAVVAEGINGQCDKVCLPDGGIIECNAVDIGYNGVCNACNLHGKCDNNAECICDNGWFDSDEGVNVSNHVMANVAKMC